jgi:hypothetical protein
VIGAWVEMAGGMDVHKNVHIENWGTARENLEKTFRFTRRNITLALIFGVAAPFLTYQGVSGEFVSVLSFGVYGIWGTIWWRSHIEVCGGSRVRVGMGCAEC